MPCSHSVAPGWDHSEPSFVLQVHQADHSWSRGRVHTFDPTWTALVQAQCRGACLGGNSGFPGAHGSVKNWSAGLEGWLDQGLAAGESSLLNYLIHLRTTLHHPQISSTSLGPPWLGGGPTGVRCVVQLRANLIATNLKLSIPWSSSRFLETF